MDILRTPEDGARYLLSLLCEEQKDFSLTPSDGLLRHVEIGGKLIPFPEWRFDPRISALYNYGSECPESISALNVYSFFGRETSLCAAMYRELDISDYILGSPIAKVTAYVNGEASNLIALTESGTALNLELGCTMANGAKNQCNHRLITKRGMACDMVVDTQTVSGMLNVFTSSGDEYSLDAGDIDLYPLDFEDSFRAFGLRTIVGGTVCGEDLIISDLRSRAVLAAALVSAERGESVKVSDLSREQIDAVIRTALTVSGFRAERGAL